MSASDITAQSGPRRCYHLHQSDSNFVKASTKFNDRSPLKRKNAKICDPQPRVYSELFLYIFRVLQLGYAFGNEIIDAQIRESFERSGREDGFCDHTVVGYTANMGKLIDLPQYVGSQIRPAKVSEKAKRLFNECVPIIDENKPLYLSPKPIDEGKCMAGAALFLKLMLKTQDVDVAKRKFKGGVPFKAALLQEMAVQVSKFSDKFILFFCHVLIAHPNKRCSELIQITEATYEKYMGEKYAGKSLPLCLGMHYYLLQGGTLEDEGFVPYVTQWIKQRFATKIDTQDLWRIRSAFGSWGIRPLEQATWRAFGLDLQPLLKDTATAKASDVINAVDNIGPGAYLIILPIYGAKRILAFHELGLFVKEDGTIYLYDSNNAIIRVDNEVKKTLEDIISGYVPSPALPGFSFNKVSLIYK